MRLEYPVIYRMGRKGKVTCQVVGYLCCAISLVGLIYFSFVMEGDGGTRAFLAILCLFFILLGAASIASAFRARVVLTAEAIEARSLFRTKAMRRVDIDGFRIVSGEAASVIELHAAGSRIPSLKLPEFIALDERFDRWLEGAKDYDRQECQASLDSILAQPERLGSVEERVHGLRQARKVARALTLASLVIGLWAIFHPRPYGLVVTLAALCPWVAVVLAARSGTFYRLNPTRNDMGADISAAILMPPLALLLRGMLDANVIDGMRLFWLSAAGTVVVTAAIAMLVRELRRTGAVILYGVLLAGYAYGVVSVANVQFDRADPQVHEVQVQDSRVRGTDNPSYYLKVGPWGPRATADEVDVSQEFYESVSKGDRVCVHLWPGALGVRWYWVGACDAA